MRARDARDRPMFWEPSVVFLKWAIALILGPSAAFLIALFMVAPEQMWTIRGGGPVVMALMAAIAWVLLLRGKIEASVYLLTAGLWTYTSVISLLLGGLNSMFIIVYPVLIIVIGWLLGSRAAVIVAALTAAACFGFYQAELRGFLPPRPATPPALFWIVQTSVFVFSAVLITNLVRSYRSRIEEVRKLHDDLNRAQAVAHVGSWVYELASDTMHLSAETCRIFGLPEGTTGSRDSYLSRAHPEDRSAVERAWQAALEARELFDHEHRILVGETIRWVRQRAEFELGSDSVPLRSVGTTQDITELRRHEAEVVAARSQLNATLDAIPDLLFEIGLDGRFHDYHSPRADLLAAPPADFLGKAVADILPPAATEICMSALREAHEHGRSHGKQYELALPQGKLWFELSVSRKLVDPGQEPRFIVLSRDITERKHSQDEYHTIIQTSIDGFWITDFFGRILDANDSICRMLGYERTELLVMSIRDIDADESPAEVAARTREIIQTGNARFQARHRRKDGAILEVEVSVLHAEALGERLFAFVRDITKRKRAEAARAEIEGQLRESQKMEALGTLAGGIAHDFNNILAAIIGNVELAGQDIGPAHPALESLEEIRKASRRARDLVQQILAFGRRQLLERKVISLAPAIDESARLLRSTLPAGVRLDIECAPDAPAVLADATQIEQVLLNLCSNAWQAMQAQQRPGAIEIRLATHIVEGMAYCGSERRRKGERIPLRPGRYACLSVRDNGPGMDQATRSRIFEPFFTTKPIGEGTGLGLAVVHGIAHDHDACIVVQSAPGEGATFRIYFPAAQPSDALVPAPGTGTAGANGGRTLVLQGEGRHILYLDDDEAIVFLMRRLLERHGYRVSGHTDAREAIAAVRAKPEAFDLVVTDYNMPGMSGLEVARTLQAIRADLPVALASGYITEELRAKAPAAGVRELIYKPDTAEDFCQIVARLVNTLPG